MRYGLYLMLFGLLVLGVACKKDNGNTDAGQILLSLNLLDEAQARFLDLGKAGVLSPQEALMETAAWLEGQDGVASVYVLDSLYLSFVNESGLTVNMQVSPVDSNGYSLFRGGGGGSQLKRFSAGGTCSNKMANKKVLLFAPVYAEFYTPNELADLATTITAGNSSLEVTILKNEQCTPEMVKDFGNYGLVIMDTHGHAESFCIGNKLKYTTKPKDEEELKSVIINTLGQTTLDKILSGDYTLTGIVKVKNEKVGWDIDVTTGYSYNIFVTTKFIKSLPKMPNTIIFGNMCYSGFSLINENVKNPMQPAWASLGVISYYGYAQPNGRSTPVGNNFSRDMERLLVKRLIKDQDSTGIAYLQTDNVSERVQRLGTGTRNTV